MLRIIREVQPDWVIGENVYGLVNWGGGVVFEQIQADLEAEGYEVWPVILPACAVNAPHKRDRVWFVAHTSGKSGTVPIQQRRQDKTKDVNPCGGGEKRPTSDTQYKGLEGKNRSGLEESSEFAEHVTPTRFICTDWEIFPTQSPLCSGNDGIPAKLGGITFPKWRNESIKAMGNAWVPQVAYEIFKVINEIENG